MIPMASRKAKAREVPLRNILDSPLKVVAVIAVIGIIVLLFFNANSISGAFFGPTADETRSGLPISVYRKLPEMPDDFGPVLALVKGGKVKDMCSKINDSYWRQPEFYPTFESSGVPLMLNPPTNREGVMGYGAFPGEAIVKVDLDETNVIRTCTFVHASWFISRYQGTSLVAVYPNNIGLLRNSFSDGTRFVEQTSEQLQEYFTIEVSPPYLLLEPTWGLFYNGWTEKADITITVNRNTPPGNYLVGMGVAPPPADKHEEWLWEYKTLYVSSGGMGIDRPFYLIGIEVQ